LLQLLRYWVLTLFQSNCAACHGADATGGVGPNIQGKNAEDVIEAINKVPMMISLKGSITKADADSIGNYLASLANVKDEQEEKKESKKTSGMKSGMQKMQMQGMKKSKAMAKSVSTTVLRSRKTAIAMGRRLFKESSLGTNGRSCNSCHLNMGKSEKKGPMGAMNFLNRKPYPHYFMMAKKVLSLDQTINFCIQMALKGKALTWDDPKLTALNAYISSIHR